MIEGMIGGMLGGLIAYLISEFVNGRHLIVHRPAPVDEKALREEFEQIASQHE